MLLVDAYNVLHQPGALALEIDVAGLCALIGASRYAGGRIVVVCDGTGGSGPEAAGAPDRGRLWGSEVVFVGPGRSADDEIEARLRRSGGGGVTVVSDDRRLRRAASRARSQSLGSDRFLANLLHDHNRRRPAPRPRFAKDLPLDRYSIAHWMREFDLPLGTILEHPPRGGSVHRGEVGGRAGEAGETAAKAGRAASTPAKPPAGMDDLQADRSVPGGPEGPGGPGTGGHGPAPDGRARRLEDLKSDAVLREALEAWRGRLSIEDLDMEQWLDGPGGRP